MAPACALTTIAILAAILFFVLLLLSRAMELRFTASYAMVDCAPPPASDAAAAAAFRNTLLPLLAALPAAAAPTGFASLQSGGGAFARGLCLGDPAPRDCLACLAAAAKKLTSCGASRRAGVWRSEGCFLAYTDGNTSSAHEDVFRDVVSVGEEVYPTVDDGTPLSNPNCFDTRAVVALAQSLARSGAANSSGARVVTDAAALSSNATGKTTVTLRAQCARDRAAAAECSRCLGDSAREVRACGWGLDGEHERVTDVLGYNCFLRIETSVRPRPVAKYVTTCGFGLVRRHTARAGCNSGERVHEKEEGHRECGGGGGGGGSSSIRGVFCLSVTSACERCCKLREMESGHHHLRSHTTTLLNLFRRVRMRSIVDVFFSAVLP